MKNTNLFSFLLYQFPSKKFLQEFYFIVSDNSPMAKGSLGRTLHLKWSYLQ